MIMKLARLLGIKFIPIAVAGIITKNKKILLTKRSYIIESGKWCLPGGKIEFGETAETAIKREIKEEINLDTISTKFLFYHDEFVPKLRLHALVLVFEVEVRGIIKSNYEVAGTRWVGKKEAEGLNYAFTHNQMIDKYWGLKR